MADLHSATFTLLCWFLYVGIALSIGAVIASLAIFAHGNTALARKLFTSGLAGVLLGASANQIFGAMVEGISLGPPADIISLAVVACLLVCSVLFFGLGKREEGVNYAVAAALAAGFIAMIPAVQALFDADAISLAGTCVLDANVTPINPAAGEPATFTVSMPYGSGSYTLYVDFGDGSTSTTGISAGGTVTVQHVYSEPGAYAVMFSARGNGSCYYALVINVGEPPSPWFLGPFDVSGFLSSVNSFLKVPLNLFYWAPEFDLDSDSEDMKLYTAVTSVAVTALGLFLAIRIVSGFVERDPSSSVVDSVKEAVLVLAVILLAPYLYQTFAYLCNQVSSLVIDRINLTGTFVSLISLVAASAILGVFSSFAGTLGGVLVYSFMLSSFAAALRYALIKGLVYCAPLLAVAYLFPAARGAVKFFMNVLAGLVLAGPVAAFVLAGLSNLGGAAGPIAAAVAPALSYLAFPIFLSMASGASPGAAAHGIARLVTGALAGFRGPATAVVPQAPGQPAGASGGSEVADASGGSGGGSGSGGSFVTPSQYYERMGELVFDRDTHTVVRSPSTSSASAAAADLAGSGGAGESAGASVTAASTEFPRDFDRDTHAITRPVGREAGGAGRAGMAEVGRGAAAAGAEGAEAGGAGRDDGGAGSSSIPGRIYDAYKRLEDWYAQSVFKQKIYPRWMKVAGKFGGWGGYGHHVVLGHVHPYSYKRMRDEIRAYRQSFAERRAFQTATETQTSQPGDLERDIDEYVPGGPF